MIRKILIVDDSAADLTNLHQAVIGTGATIISATSGIEAIEKARTEKPDVILMDIVMDDMDGYGACREITRDPITKDIPVIFVTSQSQRADKIWGEKQGAKGMINKPCTPTGIEQEIKKHA